MMKMEGGSMGAEGGGGGAEEEEEGVCGGQGRWEWRHLVGWWWVAFLLSFA